MPIYPISFSIPESKIVETIPEKRKRLAHIVPGDTSTYIFTDEASYYKDYQSAVFGRTCKKSGWDCMRHYEILANGCIPLFTDLDRCPPETMTHFPKELVLAAMKSDTPEDYIPKLLAHTRRHLTCRAMAQYVFDTVGCPTPKRVLFLGGSPYPDYLRCLTLIGMKQILGSNCVDSIVVPHIYDDYPETQDIYGKGFTYSRILPSCMKSPSVDMNDIQNGSFDLVVYGSMHRGLPYWDEVTTAYPRNKIILLCGEEDYDEPIPRHCTWCTAPHLSEAGYAVFIRELSSSQLPDTPCGSQ